ncbi:hypothetical protein SEA_ROSAASANTEWAA_10 [Streptomyces phage RosaAsantewaa]|nr:hypothetical protein SEA_ROSAASANTEWAA_10 [Streptomyces phage RosaAsantewaa]
MARFRGKVGYGESVETAPGVWEDVITEVTYAGDVLRNSLKFREGQSVNDDLSVSNSISVIADDSLIEQISALRYVVWAGAYWSISEVEVQRPRLLLRLGGVYNGPKA